MTVRSVADAEKFFHRIGRDDDGTADQIRVLLGNVIVQSLGKFNVDPLLQIADIVRFQNPGGSHCLMGTFALSCVFCQKGSVFTGGKKDVLYGFIGIFRGRGKTVDSVFIDAGGYAEFLGPDIVYQRPVQKDDRAVQIPLGTQFCVGA